MRLRTEKRTYSVEVEHNGEKGIFEVDPMTPDVASKLLKKYTIKKKWRGDSSIEPEIDWVGMRIEKTQRTIVGWDVTDEDDKPIECNDENKKVAFLLNPELINKVLAKADDLGLGIMDTEDQELKNS